MIMDEFCESKDHKRILQKSNDWKTGKNSQENVTANEKPKREKTERYWMGDCLKKK